MFTFKALEGTTSQTLRDRESTENASGQHVSSSHRGNVENQTNGGSGAAGRVAGSFRDDEARRIELEEAAARRAALAEQQRQREAQEAAARRAEERRQREAQEAAHRAAIAEQRRQQEAQRFAELNAERASRGLRPARGAALEGENQRRAMLERDAQNGRQLRADMGTSLGYEKFTKAGTLRNEFW